MLKGVTKENISNPQESGSKERREGGKYTFQVTTQVTTSSPQAPPPNSVFCTAVINEPVRCWLHRPSGPIIIQVQTSEHTSLVYFNFLNFISKCLQGTQCAIILRRRYRCIMQFVSFFLTFSPSPSLLWFSYSSFHSVNVINTSSSYGIQCLH